MKTAQQLIDEIEKEEKHKEVYDKIDRQILKDLNKKGIEIYN